jgi:hypothetical protein
MGFDYISNWRIPAEGLIFLTAGKGGALDVGGYSRLAPGQQMNREMLRREISPDSISYSLNPGMDTIRFTLTRDGRVVESLQIDLRPHFEKLLKQYASATADGIPPESMAVSAAGVSFSVKVCFWQMHIERHGQEKKPVFYNADILYAVVPAK